MCILTGWYKKINTEKNWKKNKLFSHFYGTTDETSINKTRYKKFYKEQTLELHQLPPTKDELTQHIIWANYQAYVWKRALEISIDIPSIIGHGWDRKDSSLLFAGEISQSKNQCSNVLLAHAVNHIVQTFVSTMYYQWSALMYVNDEGFVVALIVIQSKVIMMRMKRTMEIIMLTTMLRIFDADYHTFWIIVWFIWAI